MSGTLASVLPAESGLPPLTSSKWVPPTSRAAKILATLPTASLQTTHGTVGCPAVIVPAATLGSSASAFGLLFRVQLFSVATEARHGPAPETETSSGSAAVVVRPTASQHESTVDRARCRGGDRLGGEDALVLDAELTLVDLVPDCPRHGVRRAGEGDVRLDPVARRVDVQRGLGASGQRRALDPDLLPAEAADGVAAGGLCAARAGRPGARLDRLDNEDLLLRRPLLLPHDPRPGRRTGDRRTARDLRILSVLVREDVEARRGARRRAALTGEDPVASRLSKRLAKISLWPNGGVLSSYQVAHGTVRPPPAKSIEGFSPSVVWSKLSEPRKIGEELEKPFSVPGALRRPHATLESAHEYLLFAPGLVLEDRPRNRWVPGRRASRRPRRASPRPVSGRCRPRRRCRPACRRPADSRRPPRSRRAARGRRASPGPRADGAALRPQASGVHVLPSRPAPAPPRLRQCVLPSLPPW